MNQYFNKQYLQSPKDNILNIYLKALLFQCFQRSDISVYV